MTAIYENADSRVLINFNTLVVVPQHKAGVVIKLIESPFKWKHSKAELLDQLAKEGFKEV